MSIYPLRPPVVTIMGHVDHGKTTLLDSLRKTSVAAGEAGGITQHIGAFSVTLPSKKTITFLDTPGHAAFTAMRARGAHVTDIVVLVVAADDGVKPQTVEAIQHAKDANVPLIVAINKIDKHDANLDIVRQGLLTHEVFLEEDGGETQSIQVSALKGKGLDDLEEAIVTLAEMLDIRAEVDIGCEGYVIESQVERGRGNVATVLVKRGTLKVGSIIVAGRSWCKVRNMVDENGKTMKQVLPGTPIKVIGWKELPNAGDEVLEAGNEDLAKKVTENRTLKHTREQQVKDLEIINEKRRQRKEEIHEERSQMRDMKRAVWMYYQGLLPEYPSRPPPVAKPADEDEKQVKRLCAVVKGDVSGTVEAVVNALDEVGNNEIRVDVIDFGVGDVTESDIQMAAAAEGGIIIGFNVKAGKRIQSEASKLKVDILTFNIIYKLLEEVKSRLTSMLPPIIETHVTGEATILQVFQITVKGKQQKPIAGCRVTNGTILRNQRVRIMRGNQMIWEGALESLKQVKKDMTEVKKGMECGMGFDCSFEFQEGDLIQSIVTKEISRSL
ncbi:6930_t:CDS:10 [Paraglomus brasilianum]|uniref:Translation initiation factor IF-2, mitochondrial n=1 Tax=Paraglomus brasilianum TaxID=144538 RepID=A0A9N9BH30_9GLOM|nr:6930_t:CDS:10 [Paraglomus brasilianum]